MIAKYKKYFEELSIKNIDKETLKSTTEHLMFRLGEYRTYILANIHYNNKTNKIEYKNFDKIDIKVIIRELINEYTKEFIDDLNVESFLIKLNQILLLKKRNTKRVIRESFDDYYNSIEDRIKEIRNVEDTYQPSEYESEKSIISNKLYEDEKFKIQVELLKLQEWVYKNKKKIAIVFEGRDAAGKGSTIKRFIEHLNPKGVKVIALGIPTDEEKNNWFGRYEKYLPKEGEIVFFDRSWYNRAVVEPAMGYCTEEQYIDFIEDVLDWEENLINNDTILIKFWFSITKEKQLKRFEIRKNSPLKYWKLSPNDLNVIDKWDIIGKFKNQMFTTTSSKRSPWVIVNSNDKKIGRLNAMRYVLSVINYDDKNSEISKYYPEVISVIS